jgi:adenylate cyclase
MTEKRKLAAILAADVVGFSRLTGSDEEGTLARLRTLWSDLIAPTIAVHNGRVVKRTGDGSIIEFRSVVDAVRCAIEMQSGMSARLEGIAKPGAICLSEQAYWQVKSRLDLAASDLGATQLKNIAEPIRVYSLEVGNAAQAKPTKSAVPKQRSKFVLLGAGIVALIAIAGGAWYFLGASRTASVVPNAPTAAKAAHLSIVVLPFTNLSGDPGQDYFSDGITENLTTELSRIRDSFVISRNTAFTFKGKNIDTKEISKQLGVRYILEGSVQRDQNRARVNAQLVDGETGAHLWADRFEEGVTDLFKLQDEVVARLANSLGYELAKAEAQKSAHSTNPDAIDLMMRGWAALWQQPTKESTALARDYFERAMKIDPQNAEAMVGFAYARSRASIYGWSTTAEDTYAGQLDLLTKATAINPNYAFAYYVKSLVLSYTKQLPEAIEAAQTAVALDPNAAYGYFAMGLAEVGIAEGPFGRCERSIAHIKQAFALSPRDHFGGLWHFLLGVGETCLGRLDEAIAEFKRSIDAGYRTYFPYAFLAAAEAAKGNDAEAKLALAEARRLNPQLTIKWFSEAWPAARIAIDGLRKVGLPEE